MLVNFGHETKEEPDAKIEDYIEKATKFISDPMYLIWRDRWEKLVATAHVRTNVDNPRVGGVYTLTEERGKSYAKMLVHYLSLQVLKSGKTPMLFTDYDYTASNRCYEAIGYKLNCVLLNFNPPRSSNENEMVKRFTTTQNDGR